MDATATDTTERGALAKHRILLELGQGGMSNVYLAVARGPGNFHKILVLKVLRADLAEDEAFRTMALGEAKIAARLNHPNVVQTYEVLNEGDRPVIVMEYLEGQSLSSVLAKTRDGTFTLAMGLQVLVDALAGLHHAHELSDYDGKPFGLVHRDFTPQNIFLGYDGHVKIIDFGIARTDVAEGDETRAGTIKGKVRYMSPEQIIGTPAVDRRADVFAAGMVLWELATGKSPWEGEAEIAIINHVINNELPSMGALAPEVPPEIARICTKAIQFDREDRYATAAAMEADLERVLAEMDERVLPRDLGGVVSEHFREARATTKRVIEEQLAKWERGDETLVHQILPLVDSIRPTKPRGTSVAPAPVPAHAGLRPLLRAALLAFTVAVVIGLALLLRRHRESAQMLPPTSTVVPSVTAPLQAPSTPTSTASVPEERQVEIDVRATPASAILYFDDQALPRNPATWMRKADGTRHTVRAEARGYLPRAVEIVVDQGANLVISLDRAPTSPSHPPAVAAGSASHPTSGSTDCTPPFYIDTSGIKKFKPQCL
jgi:serine/threonine protein kinase